MAERAPRLIPKPARQIFERLVEEHDRQMPQEFRQLAELTLLEVGYGPD